MHLRNLILARESFMKTAQGRKVSENNQTSCTSWNNEISHRNYPLDSHISSHNLHI
ncbi:Bgt-2889 [Blumeria graminis f. sp. tritici]|uniref:Bgt-2889 n=2 Tax=Blumeria graminis f. sp. tritici TaxID=62690 RepID=A0A061HNA5_BLUGR|nr:Phosphatidylinositol transfer protein [Blumeria graminis f. sp. tritici 96224]VDB94872.1 Bgt-2889 [Blumeria graminis f. sp. tritici]